MTPSKPIFTAVVLALLGLSIGGAGTMPGLAQVPPQQLAFNFLYHDMTNGTGGIYTQYRNFPKTDENEAKGHEVLLQNTALLLQYALREDARWLFDEQMQVIQGSFLDSSLDLLHWKLGEAMTAKLNTWGAYANDPKASLSIVDSLLDASARWSDSAYRELAERVAGGLTHVVAPDRTLRSFVSWTPAGEIVGTGSQVVLDQLDLMALASLAEGSAFWSAVLERNLTIAIEGQTPTGLFQLHFAPSEGVYESSSESLLQMAETALHLAEYGQQENHSRAAGAVERFFDFVEARYEGDGTLVGRYDPTSGAPTVEWENIAAYAVIARLSRALGRDEFAERLIQEQVLPTQERRYDSPVFGAFTHRADDAYALDTLQALLSLPSRPDIGARSSGVRAVWYLGFERDSYLRSHVVDDLREIQAKLCPSHVGLFAPVYQAGETSSDPHRDPERTASDQALRRVIADVHRLGMGVVLLPPLFPDDGTWEGAIYPDDVEAWFDRWRAILLHYADLAEETGVEVFLIGSEFVSLRAHSEEWVAIIEAVRERYHGSLSYAVNFWVNRAEYEEIADLRQWELLDSIGITAYFELTHKTDPTVDELASAWRDDRNGQDVIADLEALRRRYDKSIVFWEMGYESKNGTNMFPWDFPRPGAVDEGEQADAWQAFQNVFSDVPWFGGYGIYAETVNPIPKPRGYTVLGKRAESVLGAPCRVR